MTVAILIDLGASRTKAIVFEKSSDKILDSIEFPSPVVAISTDGKAEVDGEQYWLVFERTITHLLGRNKRYAINKIYICSEMHGFLLTTEDGFPRTGYISWRDQRASRDSSTASKTTLARLREVADNEFRQTTGMRLKAGLPLANLASIFRQTHATQERLRFLSLPEWLLVRGGCVHPNVHATLAAASGLFDINANRWSNDLLAYANVREGALLFSTISDPSHFLGDIKLHNSVLSVYGGFGDLQTALHGAGIDVMNTAVVNLGTGSQVAVMGSDTSNSSYEIRLSLHNQTIRTVSHIPAGRALNAFAKIFNDISIMGKGVPMFWDIWATLTPTEILDSTLNCDLNVFDAAWKSDTNSGWIQIKEEYAEARCVFASLARSWLIQYKQALELILEGDQFYTVKVTGGLARRGEFVLPVLQQLYGDRALFTSGDGVDETLEGLKFIFNQEIQH